MTTVIVCLLIVASALILPPLFDSQYDYQCHFNSLRKRAVAYSDPDNFSGRSPEVDVLREWDFFIYQWWRLRDVRIIVLDEERGPPKQIAPWWLFWVPSTYIVSSGPKLCDDLADIFWIHKGWGRSNSEYTNLVAHLNETYNDSREG